MKELKMRSIPTALYVFSCIMAIGVLCFSAFGLYLFLGSHSDVFWVVPLFAIVVFIIPSIAWLGFLQYHFFSVFTFSEGSVSIIRPFHKREEMEYDRITAFGAASFMAYGAQIFLCTLSKTQIEAYFHNHSEECQKMYGDEIFEQYAQTAEGQFKMAVGLYMKDHKADVYALNYFSVKRLSQITARLKREAIVTGPMLLPRENEWKQWTTPK